MIQRLAVLHTVVFLADMFKELLKENLPNIENFHIVDESIIQELLREGHLTPHIIRRIATQAMLARDAGADLILFTCSSTSPAVDTVRALLDVPILKADDPLAEKAVELGTRIGVVVTAHTTLEPSVSLIKDHAAKLGKQVKVTSKLESQAFQAIISGDREEHDRRVKNAAFQLGESNDVIVLAQASMTHLAGEIKKSVSVPVLASPELCMSALKKLSME
ncbi:MAG: Asp/Glu/hydantoin racemase [Desulfobacterales bacterium]|nr:Asp/Glu/hydantoin racemase [Desulfobacterales bacterium]